jgi:hypothetical protein
MTRSIWTVWFVAFCLSLLMGLAPADAQSFQEGVSRNGPGYLTSTTQSARRCQKQCIDDGRCRAWNFVEFGSTDNCRLMSQKPASQQDPCCYSGEVSE